MGLCGCLPANLPSEAPAHCVMSWCSACQFLGKYCPGIPDALSNSLAYPDVWIYDHNEYENICQGASRLLFWFSLQSKCLTCRMKTFLLYGPTSFLVWFFHALWPFWKFKSVFTFTEDDWPCVQIIFKCLLRVSFKRGALKTMSREFVSSSIVLYEVSLPTLLSPQGGLKSLPGCPTALPLTSVMAVSG